MGRKKKYDAKAFESNGQYRGRNGGARKDTSASIFESMYRSEAYRDLTARQRDLYVCCKLQYYGKRKPGRDFQDLEEFQGDDLFYLNWASVSADYGLYPAGSERNFYKDMNALIEHGLIDLRSSGKKRRQKNIYQYSVRWKKWPEVDGTESTTQPQSDSKTEPTADEAVTDPKTELTADEAVTELKADEAAAS